MARESTSCPILIVQFRQIFTVDKYQDTCDSYEFVVICGQFFVPSIFRRDFNTFHYDIKTKTLWSKNYKKKTKRVVLSQSEFYFFDFNDLNVTRNGQQHISKTTDSDDFCRLLLSSRTSSQSSLRSMVGGLESVLSPNIMD